MGTEDEASVSSALDGANAALVTSVRPGYSVGALERTEASKTQTQRALSRVFVFILGVSI